MAAGILARMTEVLHGKVLPPSLYAVAAAKGGVGKTTLAYELAYILAAILADFDWDGGGATRAWGYLHERRKRAPLLDALERRRVPQPLKGHRKPDLVPSHPDLVANQPAAEELTNQLETWPEALQRPVVADTHPGGGDVTYGVLAAAKVVIVTAVLATKELSALEQQLEELADYPLLIVPYRVPPVPPARQLERFRSIVNAAGVPVAPPVSYYKWIPGRQRRTAICSADPVPARAEAFVDEVGAVAKEVVNYG